MLNNGNGNDGHTEPMTEEEVRTYCRQQRKMTRAAQKELVERQQLESIRGTRTAKTKALGPGNKIWLPGKRPAEDKDPTVQKKARTSKKRGMEVGSASEREDERDEVMMSAARSAPLSVQKKPTRRRSLAVESDSSSLIDESSEENDDMAGDDSDIKSMTDKELKNLVEGNNTVMIKTKFSNVGDKDLRHARLASSLFDIPDSDVQIALQSRRPSRASSDASGPPTSDFDEDRIDNDSDYHKLEDADGTQGDSDSGASDIRLGTQKKDQKQDPKALKVSKRDKKFKREQPKIKVAPIETEVKPSVNIKRSKNDDDNDAKWPDWTHLVYTSKAKLQLLQQPQIIRSVVRKAINLAEIDVITRLAWPELETSREVYRRQILYQAAKALEKSDGKAGDVKARVKASMKYAAVLGDLVMDRLSVLRSPARTVALSHIACFELGVDEVCQQRLAALVENDLYIYPGTWKSQEVEERNEQTGKIEKRCIPIWVVTDRSLIYQNKGFMDSLKDAFFDSRGSPGFKYRDQFKSTLIGRDESELTIPIVALGATGFYAALHSWSTGRFNKKEKFEGEIFNTVFERHVKYLEQIKEDNHIAFHVIMSRLFSYVTSGSTNSQKDSTSNALSVVDLSGYI